MNFIVGELVELKENIKRFPLQQTEIISLSSSITYVIEHPCRIVIIKIHHMSICVLVNGNVGWIPISIIQKVQ